MSAQATVLKKLFDTTDAEILDVKFFPGPKAVDASHLIWDEFGKALEQFEAGHAEISSVWEDKTPKRNLATFLAAQ